MIAKEKKETNRINRRDINCSTQQQTNGKVPRLIDTMACQLLKLAPLVTQQGVWQHEPKIRPKIKEE